jgi:anti-sigma28 factor (negative regulator of flagellin synthesis)
MARIAALIAHQFADRRESREARYDQGHHTSLHGDGLMDRILENINATPQEEVWNKDAPPVDIRRDKVLDIRRRIAEGTYEVADRLDSVIERVLEAITL